MLHVQRIPAPPASVHTRTVTGQQRRALRKLIRDLVVFSGTALNDLAATPRNKTPRRNRERLLYRNANSLTDTDIDRLVGEIGAARLMAALDRHTSPELPLVPTRREQL